MNNIQKAFKNKSEQGLRTGYADGGSVMGFVKDRLVAAKDALTPKVATTLRDANQRRELAVAPPQQAPAPAPADEPVKEFRFASGGAVPGTGNKDTVPAMLTPGEFVMPKDSVQAIGRENLEGLRRATHTPIAHMADGGLVDQAKDVFGEGLRRARGVFTSAVPVTPPAAPSVPSAQSGTGLRAGDWRSPVDTARPISSMPDAPAPSALARIGGGLNAGLGALGTGLAVRDINRDGLNAKNATDLAGNAVMATGSGLTALGLAAGAPLAVGGGAFLAGKAAGGLLPDSVSTGLARGVESLRNPTDTVNRMRGGGNFLAPEPAPIANLDAINKVAQEFPDGRVAQSLRSQPVVAAPASTAPVVAPAAATQPSVGLREDQPQVIVGKDGMATDAGGNPIPGYGSITNSSGKKTNLTPNSVGNEGLRGGNTYTTVVRAPRQDDTSYNEKKAYEDSLLARAREMGGSKSGFLEELRGNAGLRRQERGRAMDIAERNNTMQNAATLRGQDITDSNNRRTTEAGLRTSQAKLMQDERFHRDTLRQQGISNEKEQNAQDFAQREKGQKDLNDQLGVIFTTKDKDGKAVPDTARLGAASQAINDEIGARILSLQKVPRDNPNYAKSQELAKTLSGKGVSALDESDRRRLISQVAIKDRLMSTQGIEFLGGSAPKDTRLSGYEINNDPKVVEEGKRLFGSDVVTLKNGARIRKNDLLFTEPGNTVLPNIGKVQTDRFEAGLRGANQ